MVKTTAHPSILIVVPRGIEKLNSLGEIPHFLQQFMVTGIVAALEAVLRLVICALVNFFRKTVGLSPVKRRTNSKYTTCITMNPKITTSTHFPTVCIQSTSSVQVIEPTAPKTAIGINRMTYFSTICTRASMLSIASRNGAQYFPVSPTAIPTTIPRIRICMMSLLTNAPTKFCGTMFNRVWRIEVSSTVISFDVACGRVMSKPTPGCKT